MRLRRKRSKMENALFRMKPIGISDIRFLGFGAAATLYWSKYREIP
jgi:hypothetical protein